ncbi:hypothetical protein I3300191I4_13080 [Megasphaera elsdenii]
MLPRNGIRRGRPVSLFGPSSDDQREAQDGCQNGQQRLAARYELRVIPKRVVVTLNPSPHSGI